METEIPKKRKAEKRVRIIIVFLCVILGLLLTVGLVLTHNWNDPVEQYPTSNLYITEYGKTMVSAHRSGSGIFPENTMMAFEGCIQSELFRTDIFEFDLHLTKDGQLIILHDDTLDRTTDSLEVLGVKNARPENYTLAELRQLNFGEGFIDDAGERPYKGLRGNDIPEGLRVSTLEDVLSYLEENGSFSYVIEIKNSKTLGRRAADKLYEILCERGMLNKVIVGTFHGEITRYLDETYPDMLRSAGISEVLGFYFDSLFGRERRPDHYRFKALQIPANQFYIKLGTSRLINYAHKHNIAVQYWTINDADDIRALRDVGADCVMSDVPDLAFKVLNGEA